MSNFPAVYTPEQIEEENRQIEQMELELEASEFSSARSDLEHVLRVNGSLSGLLLHSRAVQHLTQFMWKERCEENIRFWLDAQTYKMSIINPESTPERIWQLACKIVDEYLQEGTSRCQLYIPKDVLQSFLSRVSSLRQEQERDLSMSPADLFDELQSYVYSLIERTSYEKFMSLPDTKRLLDLTAQHITRINDRK